MSKSIRRYDRFIIEKNGNYLYYNTSGKRGCWSMGSLAYTIYKYDAARITDDATALSIAKRIGGTAYRFNNLTGEFRRA